MKKYIYAIIIIALVLAVASYFVDKPSEVETIQLSGSTGGGVSEGSYHLYTALRATTTNATSTGVVIGGSEDVTFFFSRQSDYGASGSGDNAGSSEFSVEVSADGTNWVLYNRLIDNLVNSNSQTLTRLQLAVVPAGTSTAFYSMDPFDTFYAVRCIVEETTDGAHTCEVRVER